MDGMIRRNARRSAPAASTKARVAARTVGAAKAAPAPPPLARPAAVLQALPLTPERVLDRVARKFLAHPAGTCGKCGSTFVEREPAFVHCRYCGAMARIANAPLGLQEEYELRSGLRLAS